MIGSLNLLAYRPRLGASLWNYALGLQPLIVLGVALVALGVVFSLVRKKLTREGVQHT
jgi:hypothetical protein